MSKAYLSQYCSNLDDIEHERLKALGNNIKRLKGTRTQEQLAEASELNLRTWQRIEKGELNLKITTVVRIREALGCSWNELMK